MQAYFLEHKDLFKFLKEISAFYDFFVLKKTDDILHYERLNLESAEDIVLDGIRAIEPLKSFYFSSVKKVATYPKAISDLPEKPKAVLGAKACDLYSLEALDAVFVKGDFKEPFYVKSRQDNLIISTDCSYFGESCFCLSLGILPHPQKDFDLNISKIRNGYFVEAGSDKGKDVIKDKAYFHKASEAQIEERKHQRRKLQDTYIDLLSMYPEKEAYYKAIKKNYDSAVWLDKYKTCVECGGCNLTCPTCHCFVLYDGKLKDIYERMRVWDACQYAGFGKVAGGANTRPRLMQRFRNRYVHKFLHFWEKDKIIACTGCGRCIDVCMGKIDMRDVFKSLKEKEK